MIMSSPVDSLVRSSLRAVRPYVPGTTTEQARKRYGLTSVIKLSSNENPLGSSPKAVAALRAVDNLNIYLDDAYLDLRARISARFASDIDGVVLGHGSNEILALLFSAFVEPGDEVVMAVPTFSLYAANTYMQGAVPVEIPLVDGVHDLNAMAKAIGPRTKMLIVCDPNNPTGTMVEREKFKAFVELVPAGVILVIDEAYREYSRGGVEGTDYVRTRPNTLVLRTASKIYGLAALRFGYALTTADIASWLFRIRLPFNVGAPAVAAASAAFEDQDFVNRSIANNDLGVAYLKSEFAKLGLASYPTAANFIAVNVPHTADEAYQGLMKRGIVVRSGDGLRMPGYLRITVGLPDQNEALIVALKSYLEEAASGSQFP